MHRNRGNISDRLHIPNLAEQLFFGKYMVTVHIKKIREKVEFNTAKPQYIETIWGVGYRFKV